MVAVAIAIIVIGILITCCCLCGTGKSNGDNQQETSNQGEIFVDLFYRLSNCCCHNQYKPRVDYVSHKFKLIEIYINLLETRIFIIYTERFVSYAEHIEIQS